MPTLNEQHQYFEGGAHVPGVTSILGEWIKAEWYGQIIYVHARTGFALSEERMKELSSIGTAIHKGVLFMLTGQGLNWERLNPVLVAPLRQGEKWIQENRPEVILAEKPLYSKKYNYAGTLDILCVTKNTKKGHYTLIDVKSGAYDMVSEQLAAYEQLVRENLGIRGLIDRYVLAMPRSGEPYRFIKVNKPKAFQYFLSKLFEYNYLQEATCH